MNVEKFLNEIDCNFPYNDMEKGKKLIDLGISISNLCIYKILDELTRIPYGTEIKNKNYIIEYLDYIFYNFKDDIVDIIKDTCYNMVNGKLNTVNEVLILMDRIKLFKHSYGALNIVYFSCDDIEGLVEEKYEEIINLWSNK